MAVQVSYPGVYIEEFTPGAPIEGVGTNTAGFIGIAALGAIGTPTKVNSWDEFKQQFGAQPLPGFYLWYAVQGFFQNGGQTCYVVRASNGAYQAMTLNDRTAAPGRPIVNLRAREPGALGIVATVAADAYLGNVPVYRPQATLDAAGINAMDVTTQAAGPITAEQVANRFKPGDEVSFSTGTDRRVVATVSGATVRFTLPLTSALAANATMQLADTAPGARTFRLRPTGTGPLTPGQLVPGTILTFAQGGADDTQIVDSVISEVLTEGAQGGLAPFSYRVMLRAGLGFGLDLDPAQANAPTASSNEIRLAIAGGATYGRLSMDPAHPRYLLDIVNGDAGGVLLATLVEPPPPNAVADAIPRVGGAQPLNPPQAGADEDLSALTANHFIAALDTMRAIGDVNFIAIPDRPMQVSQVPPIQQALITHCELMADRFAVLDSNPGAPLFGTASVEEQRLGLDSTRGYAALYAPWLRVLPANDGPPILVPPSGHVCGIFARTDSLRGVHKAPANAPVAGALGVERRVSLVEQGLLNLRGVNIVQVFHDGGVPVLWGARTTATDTNWQYVNIRRLFLYLEESIQEGIRWAVFEPNNPELWQKLKRSIGDFLTRTWRDGALFGVKASEAFYVRIDDILNPFSEQQLGRLHIEIGVRPSYPAEFIIVRIGIWDGGSSVSES
jgi:phage tail sheath protein FI